MSSINMRMCIFLAILMVPQMVLSQSETLVKSPSIVTNTEVENESVKEVSTSVVKSSGNEGSSAQKPSDGELPKLLSYSKNLFAVYQRDVIRLVVESSEATDQFRWVKDGQTLCKKNKCEFDTAEWSIGSHNISLVVFNNFGSKLVRYKIKIVMPNESRGRKAVSPSVVKADLTQIQVVDKSDYYIMSPFGVGYYYSKKEVSLVSKLKQPLLFSGNIKSQSKSLVRIGRDSHFEVTLGPKSRASLFSSEVGNRSIKLKKGSLRFRRFNSGDYSIPVELNDAISVRPRLGSDLVVRIVKAKSGKKIYKILVLRGEAEIDIASAEGKKEEVKEGQNVDADEGSSLPRSVLEISSGNEYSFYENGNQLPVLRPRSTAIERLVFQTSTGIFRHVKKSKIVSEESRSNIERAGKLEADLKRSVAYAESGDFESSVLLLSSYKEELYKYSDALIELSRSLRYLSQYSLAERYLELAKKVEKENPLVFFELGLLSLERGRQKKSISLFKKALDLGYENAQEAHYYIGVAKFHEGSTFGASNSFVHSDWVAQNEFIYNSSQDFQRVLKSDKSLSLFTKGVAFTSNKLLPLGEEYSLSSIDDSTSYYGYYGIFNLDYSLYRSKQGAIDLQYRFDRRGHLLVDQRVLDTVDQEYMINMAFQFNENPGSVGMYFKPSFGNNYVGDERVSDFFVGTLGVRLPSVYNLDMSLASGTYVDPFPEKDDLLGPERFDIVSATDRSRASTELSIEMQFPWTDNFYSPLLLQSHTVAYKDSTVAEESNMSAIKISIGLNWFIRPWWENKLSISSNTFTYDNSATRADSESIILIENDYWFSRYFASGFYYKSYTNSSSEDQYSYSRADVGFSLSLKY